MFNKRNMAGLIVAIVFMMQNLSLPVFVHADSTGFEVPVQAAYYVSVEGNDNNKGTEASPFRTLEKARDTVRGINKNMTGDILVYIRGGIYTLSNTFSLNDQDSGTNGYYVKYMAYPGESPVVSGGEKVGGWTKHNDKLWKAQIITPAIIRDLYVNSKKARRAQTESLVKGLSWYNNTDDNVSDKDGIYVNAQDVPVLNNASEVQLHWARGWKSFVCNVDKIIPSEGGKNIILMKQPTFSKPTAGSHAVNADSTFLIENAFEFLDREGEFYYNSNEKMLYYMPRSDEDMNKADVYVPILDKIMEIKGNDLNHKVKNIKIDGLTFSHGTWARASISGWVGGQAQTMVRDEITAPLTEPGRNFVPANIQLQAAERIELTNNVFKGLGCVGIGFYEGVNYTNVIGNVFEDIADSAISVGLPYHNYVGETYEGRNLALFKKATALSYTDKFEAEDANDDDVGTGWSSGKADDLQWWQVDLGEEYNIDRIEIVARPKSDQITTRRNFEVLASNKPDFSSYVVLARQGAKAFEPDSTLKLHTDEEDKYRYVRIRKTAKEYFYLAEARVINESMEYVPAKEVCKFNKIQNNYITRVGDYQWGAPGIQSYYTENLDVSHNELYDLPYSGIGMGWGWDVYRDSVTNRDNRINYNKIHKFQQICFDGGGIYTLGNMPNSTIIGNYLKDQFNCYGGIYTDQGTAFLAVEDNVLENVPLSFFVWTPIIRNVSVKNNYTTTPVFENKGENCVVENTTLFIPGRLPKEALDIADNAGLEEKFKSIVSKASKKLWDIPEEMLLNNVLHENSGSMPDSKFVAYYFKNPIQAAQSILDMAQVGIEIGQYPQTNKDEFKAAIEKAKVISKKEPIDRNEIVSARSELEAQKEKFLKSRNSPDIKEIISMAEELANSAPIGFKEGEYPKEVHDALVSDISMVKKKMEMNASDTANIDNAKARLELAMSAFKESRINLDIKDFSLPSQIGKAEIDSDKQTIDVTVKYDADLAYQIPKMLTSKYVKVSPEAPADFNNPVAYSIETNDQSSSKLWTINVTKEKVIHSDKPYQLSNDIQNPDSWVITGFGTEIKNYKSELFGDIMLEFNMNVEAKEDDWPSITLRNKSFDESFTSKNSEAYIICFKQSTLEVQRFNNGKRTVFYGNIDGFKPIIGDKLVATAFKFGQPNKIQVGTLNVQGGVRLILKINGEQVFDFIDNSEGAIYNPGYFGTVAPKAKINLSAVTD